MKIALDIEGHKIQPGLLVPPMVCLSWATESGETGVHTVLGDGVTTTKNPDGSDNEVFFEGWPEGRIGVAKRVAAWLEAGHTIIGANIVYDLAVFCNEYHDIIPLVFQAYNQGRIWDIQIAQRLDAVAGGHLGIDPRTGGLVLNASGKRGDYDLHFCVSVMLGRSDAKENSYWRLRYAMLENIPFRDWPAEARQYPVDDSVNTFEVQHVQEHGGLTHEALRNMNDLPSQCRAAFALHLGAVWGIRTDRDHIEKLSKKVEAEWLETLQKFKAIGFLSDEGKEKQAVLKDRTARALGATLPCPSCHGVGKIPCKQCGDGKQQGSGRVPGKRAGTTRKCLTCKGYGYQSKCPDCDGTGLNLSTAVSLSRTEKGAIQCGRDILTESGDDDLEAYAAAGEDEKIRTTYIPWLWGGIEHPINLRPNSLLETGRVSYRDPSQTFPRKGGVREAIVARLSWLLCSTDYSMLELCTLSQICLWLFKESAMAESINAGNDLHSRLGARLINTSYDDFLSRKAAKEPFIDVIRGVAKNANFGLGGGMGPPTFVQTCKKVDLRLCCALETAPRCDCWNQMTKKANPDCRRCYGRGSLCGVQKTHVWGKNERPIAPTCVACLDIAKQIIQVWKEQWPEMKEYFRFTAEVGDKGFAEAFVSGRIRGSVQFTQASNGFFQALAADGAKHALWMVTQACYTGNSVLRDNCRIPFFVHDELLTEIRESVAHEAAWEVSRIQVEAMQRYVPDVKIVAEPALMRRWFKKAEKVEDANGRLIPWEPKNCRGCDKKLPNAVDNVCPHCGFVLWRKAA